MLAKYFALTWSVAQADKPTRATSKSIVANVVATDVGPVVNALLNALAQCWKACVKKPN
jgi:hypothetical protein